jgi:hypothetical protein
MRGAAVGQLKAETAAIRKRLEKELIAERGRREKRSAAGPTERPTGDL